MNRINSFVKVSGDSFENTNFLVWLDELSRKSHVVICVGGGTQINEEFARRGLPFEQHGPLGRETKTFEERQIARDVLEINAARFEDLLAEEDIPAHVVIPVITIGGVLCHLNGDLMVEAVYLGYDQLFVVTIEERRQTKEQQFARLSKVKVLSFDQ